MILSGKLMCKTSLKINNFIGYRTARSTKNEETWKFANKHCGNLWQKLGLIMAAISLLTDLLIINSGEKAIGIIGSTLIILETITVMFSVIPTEKALKNTFTDDGQRK